MRGGDGDEAGGSIPARSSAYVVFAWNDLGMHCLNPTYDTAVLLPPYNNLWVQVVRRDVYPELVTSGVTVRYRILNNTFSYGKTNTATMAEYGQFWDNAEALFGAAMTAGMATDTGLNLVDAALHNGLAGTMLLKVDHFEADGIPVTPVDDDGVWNPYQVAEITVRDQGGAILAQTRATVPTSDEIACGKSGCHSQGPDIFMDILMKHDQNEDTALTTERPVLCANGTCHTSPALGQAGPGDYGYLSMAVHSWHSDTSEVPVAPACYDCHPGQTTRCSRSLRHTASDGNCTSCHGTLADVGATGRIPWIEVPKCLNCHTGMGSETDTGGLFRQSAGHGGMSCPSCHGSPHAMLPSREASDGYQAVQYQGEAVTIGSCGVCHGSSRGGGSAEFFEEHGGSRASACNVCHTQVPFGNTALWPHQFMWTGR